MISDTLSDAAADIRRQMEARGQMYDGIRTPLEDLLVRMDTIRAYLDQPPGASFEEVETRIRFLARLRELGFVHHETEDPHEDYWLLEGHVTGIELLVEREPDGWSICRMPRDEEPRAQWIDVARSLDDGSIGQAIDKELKTTGVTADD